MKMRVISLALVLSLASMAAAQTCDWANATTWPACILIQILKFFTQSLIQTWYDVLRWLILANPNPSAVNGMVSAYMLLLQPIYMMSIVITAFYLLFVSGSPQGRARAKDMLWKLILSMMLVSISPQIFKLALSVAYGVSVMLLPASNNIQVSPMIERFITVNFVMPLFFPLLPIFAISMFFAILSIALRWVGVMIMAALFPFTIFLYFFEPPYLTGITKTLSNELLKMTLGFIFAQPVQALMLAITVVGLGGTFHSTEMPWLMSEALSLCVVIAGIIMIGIAPLMAMGLLSWIGGAMMAAGMGVALAGGPAGMVAGMALTAGGGLMMGMGPNSLTAAGGVGSMAMAQMQGQGALQQLTGSGGKEQTSKWQNHLPKDGSGHGVKTASAAMSGDVKGALGGLMGMGDVGPNRMAGGMENIGRGVEKMGEGTAQAGSGVSKMAAGASQLGADTAAAAGSAVETLSAAATAVVSSETIIGGIAGAADTLKSAAATATYTAKAAADVGQIASGAGETLGGVAKAAHGAGVTLQGAGQFARGSVETATAPVGKAVNNAGASLRSAQNLSNSLPNKSAGPEGGTGENQPYGPYGNA